MSSVAGRLTSLGRRVTNSSPSGWATGHSSVTCPRASRLRPGSGSGGGSCFGVDVRGPAGRRDQGVNPRVRGAGSCGESLLRAFVRDRPPVFPGLRVPASCRRCRVAARPCAQARTPPRTERGRLPTGPPSTRMPSPARRCSGSPAHRGLGALIVSQQRSESSPHVSGHGCDFRYHLLQSVAGLLLPLTVSFQRLFFKP